MFPLRIKLLVLFLLTSFFSNCPAQDEKNKEFEGATVKGRLAQHENENFQVDLNEFKTVFNQRIMLPPPPVPEDKWPEMKPEERQQWIKQFEESEKGKKFIEERQKLLEAAHKFELQVEKDGSFVVYDVPSGVYGLRGRLEEKVNDKNYVFEVFGQVEVTQDVEEVLLDPLAVTATRLLKAGEPIPNVSIVTFDGKAKIDSKLLKDRFVLVSFWSLKSPPSLVFAKTVQETFQEVKQKHNLQLFSVCVDSDRKKALEYVVDNHLRGWHGYAETWDHDLINEFGVRSIPALFLLGSDGLIKMTHADFQQAFRTRKSKLPQIVADSIAGKKFPVPKVPEGEQESGQQN